MTYHDEQRRTLAPRVDRDPPLRSGIEWGLPLGIAGAALVLGLVFYNVSHVPTQTAGTGGTVHSTPAPNTGQAPPPAKTQ
ncbi:MAG: hypothetical protein E6G97_20900 [Alphaproteobacteria bacterium]|nr:MAG: hypothetical protein E6G97_20900 [Alphaproteobacteria bacterium]